MAIIKPFRALRPVPDKAKQVSCVPYDVVYESEVRAFIKKNPLSFLRVTRPEAEFPEGAEVSAEQANQRAKENLESFIEQKILAREAELCLYIYRMEAGNHTQTGVVGCYSIDEYDSCVIKEHEKTRPDKVEDRTVHMLELKAQTGLIFLAFRNTDRIRLLISEITGTKPIYNFHCSDGTKQTVWEINLTDDWIKAFAEVPAMYIADGHHRAESAKLAREILRDKNPEHTGAEHYNFVIAGMFPAEDLQILAYNRVVKDLGGITKEEFFKRVKENFTLEETVEKIPAAHGEICLYMDGKWYKLDFLFDENLQDDPIGRLDVSILQDFILQPILDIDDPRTNKRVGFIGGARGTDELEKVVNDGIAKLAFSLYPTTMDDLFAVADIGKIMPPKSTWFEPKLKDGLLIHEI